VFLGGLLWLWGGGGGGGGGAGARGGSRTAGGGRAFCGARPRAGPGAGRRAGARTRTRRGRTEGPRRALARASPCLPAAARAPPTCLEAACASGGPWRGVARPRPPPTSPPQRRALFPLASADRGGGRGRRGGDRRRRGGRVRRAFRARGAKGRPWGGVDARGARRAPAPLPRPALPVLLRPPSSIRPRVCVCARPVVRPFQGRAGFDAGRAALCAPSAPSAAVAVAAHAVARPRPTLHLLPSRNRSARRATRSPPPFKPRRGPSRCAAPTSSPSPKPGPARRAASCCPASCTARRRAKTRARGRRCACSRRRASSRCRSRKRPTNSVAPAVSATRARTAARPRGPSCATCATGCTWSSRPPAASTISSRAAKPASPKPRTSSWTKPTACSTWGLSPKFSASCARSRRRGRRSSSPRRGRARSSRLPPSLCRPTRCACLWAR